MAGFRERILKTLCKLNLRDILFLSSVFLVMVFLFGSGYVSYRTTVNMILKRTEKIDESTLKQINNKLTSSVGEIEKLIRNFSGNDALIQYLSEFQKNRNDIFNRVGSRDKLLSLFVEIKVGYEDIYDIEICTKDGNFIQNNGNMTATINDFKKTAAYKKLKMSKNGIVIDYLQYKDITARSGFRSVTFTCNLYKDNQELGTLYVIMNPNWMNRLFGDKQNIIIGNKSCNIVLWYGNKVSSNTFRDISGYMIYNHGNFQCRIGNENYNVFYMDSKYNDWVTITFKRMSDILKPVKEVRNFVFLASAASVVLSFILALFISGRITKPICHLTDVVKKYRIHGSAKFNDDSKGSTGLRDTFMIFFIVIITIPMLINSAAFFFISSRVTEDKVRESVMLTFRQTINNIDSFITLSKRISTNIMFDKYIQNILIENIENDYRKPIINTGKIGRIIDENLVLGSNIFEVSLYGGNNRLLFSTSYYLNEDTIQKELFESVSNTYGNAVWFYYDKDRYDRNVIRLIRKINVVGNKSYLSKTIGYLLITYYESIIEELYRDINLGDSSVYIVDNSGVVISHRFKSLIGSKSSYVSGKAFTDSGSKQVFINGKRYLLAYSSCYNLPWILIGEIPYSEISKDRNQLLIFNIFALIAAIFIILLVAYKISFVFTRSINRLKSGLVKLSDGNTGIDFTRDIYINEVKELGETFNDMTKRISELIEKVYHSQMKEKELEKEKKDAELVALQSQINPHFLYNTLESIKCMVEEEKKDAAKEMITALGDVFRLGISRENQLITVEEEIRHADAYIEIQKFRLGKRIAFSWSIDEKILSCLTLKLIIQPIIENSIYHGVQKKAHDGNIKIYCYGENDSIVYKIVDDGQGIEEEQLEKIQRELKGELTGTSIGIYNVQKRIQLYFGNSHGLTIKSQLGVGTMVMIRIPRI